MDAFAMILSRIHERGPITVAEFMSIALYEPGAGYYARRAQRSGRDGDFFTSVDVGSLFGELLAVQIEEISRILDPTACARFDLVEAAAGNGRLSRDILDAIAAEFPALYRRLRLFLVEVSPEALAQQREVLGPHLTRLAYSGPELPFGIEGTLIANELLDALPVHVLLQTDNGLREVFVGDRSGALVEILGEISSQALVDWVSPYVAALEPGARFEIGLAADSWIRSAAAVLDRGFLLLFDYGHEAEELLGPAHAMGTLTSYQSHKADARSWLATPGDADLTSHVNLTAIRRAAQAAGLTPAGLLDQSYFLLSLGLTDRVQSGSDIASIRRRLAARTLIMPGGLGSTMKAMAFAKAPAAARLRGFSSGRLS